MSGLASSPWTLGTSPRFSTSKSSSSSSSYFDNSKFSAYKLCRWRKSPPPSYNCFRLDCRSQFAAANDLKFVLHDVLDSSDVNITHARVARARFCSQIKKLSEVERGTSISINREVDLGETALYIAAEDDSLISHSSVPLPVEAFIERLDDLSMDYCSHYSSSFRSSPEKFLDSLERYLYFDKGFRRNNSRSQLEQRALYLHSVLTHRLGSASMLSLIYSEILKMLRLWGLIKFDVEIFFPHDSYSSPRGYLKQKSKESDQLHIMTSQSLLVKMLRDLKNAFWPFQGDRTTSLFLRAAEAANCYDRSDNVSESGFELASAKAARHRLARGVYTSVPFGDMRRALAACERLIIIGSDSDELRDYGALLYHCGFYEESLHYLTLYHDATKLSLNSSSVVEEDKAVEKLIIRLNLIMSEEGWTRPSARKYLHKSSEPW